MHKNPKVPKSAELPPRDSHCQYLIKQRSIVGVSVSWCVCTCRGGMGTFILYVFLFIVKSYWYYTEGCPGRVMSSVAGEEGICTACFRIPHLSIHPKEIFLTCGELKCLRAPWEGSLGAAEIP